MERGIFRADTPEEQERGLQVLENLGRIRASKPQQNNAPTLRRAPRWRDTAKQMVPAWNEGMSSLRSPKQAVLLKGLD